MIELDSATNGATTESASSLTASHTCSGNNRLLLVGVAAQVVPTAVTYNGVAMTAIDHAIPDDISWEIYLYGLIAPDSGAHDVVVTMTGAWFIHFVTASYKGVLQTELSDAHLADVSPSAQASFTKSLTTTKDNCWVHCFGVTGTPVPSTGMTQRGIQGFNISGDSNGEITPAGLYSMTLTGSGTYKITMIMTSFAPAPSSSASTSPGFLMNFT